MGSWIVGNIIKKMKLKHSYIRVQYLGYTIVDITLRNRNGVAIIINKNLNNAMPG